MDIDDLLKEAQNGDKKAESRLFEILCLRFTKLANYNSMKNKQDIEDIVQKALITVASEYKKMDFQTGFLKWADRIMTLKLWNHFTKRRRWKKIQIPLSDYQHEINAPSTDEDQELRRMILRCFEMVVGSEKLYANVLALSYEGYKAPEISQKMSITTNYCYYLLSIARAKIEECLEKGKVE
ncbi:MAG: hypothetical protein GF315_08895 [candidate division Zixibacteria bacterium]|nr:hypothetical protein [candidate division Zixibacteria bacterium]